MTNHSFKAVCALSLNAVYRCFEARAGQTKVYEIGICFAFPLHAVLRRKSKYWLARNQDTVSDWSDMFIRGHL